MIIEGKVALITGGVGGLGKAFATALLQAKAKAVCLVDISNSGEHVVSELQQQFPQSSVDFYSCDVTDYDQFKGSLEHVQTKYGGVDILCNNAGIIAYDTEIERSIKSLRINLEGVYIGTRLGMDYMNKKRGRGGVVVNTASVAAFETVKGYMCYNGSKAGVVALTKSAGLDLNYNLTGVRVNALCPGLTETPILEDIRGVRQFTAATGYKLMTPEYVAQGFVRLVEDETLCGAVLKVTNEAIELVGEPKSIAELDIEKY